MAIRSIRWRIQLWYAVVLSCIVGSMLWLHHRHERELLYQSLDEHLRQPVNVVRPYLRSVRADLAGEPQSTRPRRARALLEGDERSGPGERTAPSPLVGAPFTLPIIPSDTPRRGPRRVTVRTMDQLELIEEWGFYFTTWSVEKELELISANAPAEAREPCPYPAEPGILLRTRGKFRQAVHLTPIGDLLIIGKDTTEIEDRLTALAWKLTGIGSALVAGGLFVGYFLVCRSLRPIKAISDTAVELAEGRRQRRIERADTDSELGQLAEVLNNTFDRLTASYDQQVRFTADASHEIRTPIAVILAEGSFALSRERSPERYREALKICVDSAEHMSALTESLLQLARFDSGEFQVNPAPGNYAEAIEQAIILVSPLAQKRNITIARQLGDIKGHFDAPRLNQVLINLLSNAIKYNYDGGRISVTLRSTDSVVRIEISDTGPGIPAQKLPHIFDRFYRADEAHSETTQGSTGLGLAITKKIVESHSGTITATSTEGDGSTFTIELPIRPDEER